MESSVSTVREALRAAGIDPSDLSRALLVGGGGSIPLVAEIISSRLGLPVTAAPHPAHTVAHGAALTAAAAASTPARAVVASPVADLPVTVPEPEPELRAVTTGPIRRPAVVAPEPAEPLRSRARKFEVVGAAAAAIAVLAAGGRAIGTAVSDRDASADSANTTGNVAGVSATTGPDEALVD
ncbi:Hsp70 family protein, partial [Rhodococcus chondri]